MSFKIFLFIKIDLVCSGNCLNIVCVCKHASHATSSCACQLDYNLTKDSFWVSLIMSSGIWKLTSVRVKEILGEFTCINVNECSPSPLKRTCPWAPVEVHFCL